MAERIALLKQKEIEHAAPPRGRKAILLADGGNLYLQATRSSDGTINRSWIFRYQEGFKADGRRRRHDLGLGPLHTFGLAAARQRALELRQQIKLGNDPLESRRKAKRERLARQAEAAKAVTFEQCAEMFLKRHSKRWKNAKHRAQWASTLKTYAYPIIGKFNVIDVDVAHIQKVLAPIWDKIPETASRVQKRIENILDFATASKFRAGENPARWSGNLKQLIGPAPKKAGHHAALPFLEAPAFMAGLRGRNSTSAQALEFTILTAARTAEVIGATWEEIDLDGKTWTVPGERMKAKAEHKVPLTKPAIELLDAMPKPRHGLIFRSGNGNAALSNMAMLELLRGMRPGLTVHGFRSTFRDWAAERTNYPNHVAEKALAHKVSDAVEAAYRRGDLAKKRAGMMKQWSDFLATPLKPARVSDFAEERAKRSTARQ
jgi:integrase